LTRRGGKAGRGGKKWDKRKEGVEGGFLQLGDGQDKIQKQGKGVRKERGEGGEGFGKRGWGDKKKGQAKQKKRKGKGGNPLVSSEGVGVGMF